MRDVDYTLNVTGNSITIPAGQSSYDIIVTPNPASSNRGDKTVVLTLSPDTTNTFTLDSAAASATVTIQDDSAPPATQLSLSSIAPNKGGDMGSVTANIYGANIKPGATVKLARSGQADITGTNVSVAANGLQLTATFDLTNKQQGVWDVVVTNADGKTATLTAAFTIEANKPSDVWVDVIGRYTLRSGTVQRFYLVYGNRGNTDAPATVLRLYVPQGLSVVEPVTLPDGSQPVVYTNTDGTTTSVQLFVPGVPAGTTAYVPVNLQASVAHQDLKLRVTALNSPILQPSVAVAVDPSFTLTPTVTENTDASFKMTIHVNSSKGSGDINVQTTFADATTQEPSSTDVTNTGDVVQYIFTSSVARSSIGTATSSQSPFVKTVVKTTLSKALDAILTQVTSQQSANALRKYQFEVSLFTLLGQEGTLTADQVNAKLALARGELVAATLKQALQILSKSTGTSPKSALEPYERTARDAGAFGTQGAINAVNAVANAVQSATEKGPQGNDKAPPSPNNNALSNEQALHNAMLDVCKNLKALHGIDSKAPHDVYDCQPPPGQLSNADSTVNVVFSADPNEKDGAQGAGDAAHFVSGFEPFRYVISFENKPDATAPAATVVVTDQLDAAKLDFSTFSLGPIGFSNTVVSVPPGLSTYTTDVDLRPAKNLIARVNAQLDKSTGLLTWRFTSIDPATGQPTNDPLAGLLPPNKTSPEGQGDVTFSVKPRTGLTTGTEIRNASRIVFDNNAPIDTNVWLNTIDNSTPVSRITALDASQSSLVFNLQWSGTDTGSGIASYTIYVSENGGAFSVLYDGITATSSFFVGKPGKTYSFYSVARDKTGNVEPAKTTAEATTTVSLSVQNPLDDTRFFVRQQYLDFLNRDPDQSGFDYWTGLITKCAATDTKCINAQRVSVSAAFFIEQEFQDTGSFVYRFYKGSLGRQPAYDEFVSDRSRVIGGTSLEASKSAFAEAWTQRAEFLAKYPATLSNDSFVDALLQTVKQTSNVDLTSQRQTFVNQLQASGGTRSQVIRAVVDAQAFQKAEYNRAFVLMQYFGYLRRDPDTAGYNFWLDILNNRVANNYRSMVCAFITSAEYQLRFGSVVTRTDQVCGSIGQ